MVTEAGGLVGNFSGDADFLEQSECMAGNPRIYGQMVGILGKYSKFASAGEKATVRQAAQTSAAEAETTSDAATDSAADAVATSAPATPATDAPF